jgi:serine O-acetyltransferase
MAASADQFFFIHLMKTAGTSFAFQLRENFAPQEIYPSNGTDARDNLDVASYVSLRRLLDITPQRRAEVRIFTGHFPFVASELLDLDLVRLTLLRNPVDRTVSVLKHFKRLTPRVEEMSLEEIYDDPFVFGHFIENHQAMMFSVTADDKPEAFGSSMTYWGTLTMMRMHRAGSPNDDQKKEMERLREIAVTQAPKVDAERFARAKANLERVDVIGFSEHYGEFIDELRDQFGWWPTGLHIDKKVNRSPESWEVSDALRKRIEYDNALDIEFYEYAQGLVARRARPHRSRPADEGPKVSVDKRHLRDEIRAKHPKLLAALVADAKVAAVYRSERSTFRGRGDALLQVLRLMCVSDAFLAQALYRAKARMQALGIPVLPWIAHRLAMMTAQVCIGDPVVMRPGVYIAHGQVVIDGFVEVHRGAVIFPWVTIGLRAGDVRGPTIGRDVHIGTGAKIIGPVTIHHGARIGANAVVVSDVAPDTTVIGAPARPARAPASFDG